MKPILAIETSTRSGSVAIWHARSGEPTLIDGQLEQGDGHAEILLPLIDALMREAGLEPGDLGLVAVGQGPGAFTGIRLGCSVAQGIAMSLQLPMVTVNALLATAMAFDTVGGITMVALDARMDEVYFAVYAGAMELQQPVLLAARDVPAFVQARLRFWWRAVGRIGSAQLVGEGWQVVMRSAGNGWIDGQALALVDCEARPRAREVAAVALDRWQAGKTLVPEQALPLYLRNKVAFTTQEREQGHGGNPKAVEVDPVLVLPMMPVDLDEVVELERQSQAFPWSRRNFEDALAAGYPAWVLRISDALVGFCVAMPTPDDVHVLVIAISADHRRQGLGKRLLAQVEQLAIDHGVDRVLLEVRPSNLKALAFYRQTGFERIGIRRGYYPAGKGAREDALVMARCVNQTSV